MRIYDAKPSMAESLTDLAMRSKASWGYDSALIEQWSLDLTITPEDIETKLVKVAGDQNGIAGFASFNLQEWEIDHFWVEPQRMRSGVGRMLLEAIRIELEKRNIEKFVIVSDPNAQGFYERMGAKRIAMVESVPSGRMLPKLSCKLKW